MALLYNRKDYVRGELRHLKTPIWPDTWKILSGKYKEVCKKSTFNFNDRIFIIIKLISPEMKRDNGEASLEEFVPVKPSFSKLIADMEEYLH